MTILIIEDDAVGAQIFGQHLREAGYSVLWAETGPTGLQIADQAKPDGVLLDIMLPGVPGKNILAELRARHPEVPVVAYTNGFVPAVIEEVTAAGAITILNKATLSQHELKYAFDKVLKPRNAA